MATVTVSYYALFDCEHRLLMMIEDVQVMNIAVRIQNKNEMKCKLFCYEHKRKPINKVTWKCHEKNKSFIRTTGNGGRHATFAGDF